MRTTLSLLGFILPFLLACTEEPPAAVAAAPYKIVTDVHQTMLLILDPAVDVIWDSAGTIITAEGRQELAPTTDEGWQWVLQNAAIVAEVGNLLMMPGRSAGDDWREYAGGLIEAGTVAMKAAQEQDSDALFDAGGQIYQVCLACHSQYLVEVDGSEE